MKRTFQELVLWVIMQNQQMAAGCPADCEENPSSCDKEFDEIPPECRDNLLQSMDDPEDFR